MTQIQETEQNKINNCGENTRAEKISGVDWVNYFIQSVEYNKVDDFFRLFHAYNKHVFFKDVVEECLLIVPFPENFNPEQNVVYHHMLNYIFSSSLNDFFKKYIQKAIQHEKWDFALFGWEKMWENQQKINLIDMTDEYKKTLTRLIELKNDSMFNQVWKIFNQWNKEKNFKLDFFITALKNQCYPILNILYNQTRYQFENHIMSVKKYQSVVTDSNFRRLQNEYTDFCAWREKNNIQQAIMPQIIQTSASEKKLKI